MVNADIQSGLDYLYSTQNADGSWGGTNTSLTTKYIAISEVLKTLALLETSKSSAFESGNLYFISQPAEDTDYLIRRIEAKQDAGKDASQEISQILSYQTADGLWGGAEGHEYDAVNTALVLSTLKTSGALGVNDTANILWYLQNSLKNADGSYGFNSNDGSVFVSSIVLDALSQTKHEFAVDYSSTVNYLLSHQNQDGGFGGGSESSVFETALAVIALLNAGADQSAYSSDAFNYILSSQMPNGSWDDDPYSTALALRVLTNVKPNLTISAADVTFSNPKPIQGETITISVAIHNTGLAQAENVSVQFYNGDPANGGSLIGDTVIPLIEADKVYTAGISWVIPALSECRIFITIDQQNLIQESNEEDNVAYNNITAATLPDLSITSGDITFMPMVARPGQIVEITSTVRNKGETKADNVTVDIYKGNPSEGGLLIGNTKILSMPAGGVANIKLQIKFTEGIYDIYVVVDSANTIIEGNETNNTATKSLYGRNIDLLVTTNDITFNPPQPVVGDIVDIRAIVHNDSEIEISNVPVSFFLGDPDAGGTQINPGAAITIPIISARGEITVNTKWDSRGYVGNNDIYVKVDPLDIISEVNELNNKVHKRLITATDNIGPDLTISSTGINYIPKLPETGGTVTISAKISNTGVKEASNVLVEFSLGDPNIGGSSIIGSEIIPFIAVGEAVTAAITWNTSGFSGPYDLYSNIDPLNEVFELDEFNNTAHVPLIITTPQGPDLVISAIDTSNLVTDTQALGISGSISVTLENKGNQDSGSNFIIAVFEDKNGNERLDMNTDNILGEMTYTNTLVSSGKDVVEIPLTGSILFRDNLIYAMVDTGNLVKELNETNNIRNTGQECEYIPPVGSFNPVVKWAWTQSATVPEFNESVATVSVARLIDTNNDGILNASDVPVITFVAVRSACPSCYGGLFALRGDNAEEIFAVTDADHGLRGASGTAIGDINNDGFPEIIVQGYNGNFLAFNHNGTLIWKTQSSVSLSGVVYPSIADLDKDGKPEIVVGNIVLNNDGSTRWKGSFGKGQNSYGVLSLVADVDLDGYDEVVAGNTVYRADGTVYWRNTQLGDGFNAVANFDDDPYPELVLVSVAKVYLLDHDGNIKWGPKAIDGSGGAPTVADFDGDGLPEIGVAGSSRYMVFRSDGSILWQSTTQDYSSSITGSSVFDFDGDGRSEVIYADEKYLRIYDGATGAVKFITQNSSATGVEYPVIADVDNDNRAEIVLPTNDWWAPSYINGKALHGLRVIEDQNDNWVNTRKIWNQYSYHITNVNDDGSIPIIEENNWLVYNNYRCNALLPEEVHRSSDVTVSFLSVDQTNFPASVTALARIGNGGAINHPAGTNISFYDGNPSQGGTLIGMSSTTKQIEKGDYEDVSVIWNTPTYGMHDLYVIADVANMFNECRENNNLSFASLFIDGGNQPPRSQSMPDIEITSEDLSIEPTNPVDGQPAMIKATLRNIGTLVAYDVKVSFYEGDPDHGGILIDSITKPTIDVGIDSVAAINWNTSGKSGRSYIHVIVDPQNLIEEANENNNAALLSIDVAEPTKPDLTVTASDLVFSNMNPREGDALELKATIHNLGTDVSGVAVNLYDGDPTSSGNLLSQKSIPQIIPFGGSVTLSYMIDTIHFSGMHTLYISVDPDNQIDEISEANNTASKLLSIAESDLTLNVTTDAPQYRANTDVGIDVVIKNNNPVLFAGTGEIVIEDQSGNLIHHVDTFNLDSLPPVGIRDWMFRIPVHAYPAWNMQDALADVTIDFTGVLGSLGIGDKTVDQNSIRVIELDTSGNVIGEKQAKAIFQTGGMAEITWLMDGLTLKNMTRYFYVYFDITENGAKDPSVNTTLPVRTRLVAFTDEAGNVYTIESHENGTFGAPVFIDDVSTSSDMTRGVMLNDFNNDGFADIVTGSGPTGKIYYYQNKADGSNAFNAKKEVGTIITSGYIMDLSSADFNHDGNQDFVVSGHANNYLYLFEGNGDGTFVGLSIPAPSGSNYFRGNASADVNGDGNIDLVIGNNAGVIFLYKNNGDGTFLPPVQIADVGTDSYGVAVGDFNEDGKLDILANNDGSGDTYILKGKGDGTFEAPVLVASLDTNSYAAFDSGDFNDDGHLDIIAATYAVRNIEFYPGNGNGTFGPKVIITKTTNNSLGISASPEISTIHPAVGTPESVPSSSFNFIWNTGNTLPGEYKVHVTLADNTGTIAEDSASFTILPDIRIDANVVTDRISYNPNGIVTISSRVTSLSENTILENLLASVSIINGNGEILETKANTISMLTPGQLTDLKNEWNTSTHAAGTYTVRLEVFDGSTLLGTSTSTFEILGTSATGAGLTGSISSTPNAAHRGEDVALSYTVTSIGNEDMPNLNVKVLVIDPETEQVKQTFEDTVNLAMGGSVTNSHTLATTNLLLGTYIAILQAPADHALASAVFTVINIPPVALAGSDQEAHTGDTVTLDGSTSYDPDNGPKPLTYQWGLVSKPESSALTDLNISNAATAIASFVPDEGGTYVLALTVSDGKDTATDTISIEVTSNLPPVADAGPDRNVFTGDTVTLDGSGSFDPDSGPELLVYQWSFVSVPAGSSVSGAEITDSGTPSPSFVPDVDGTYVLVLDVSDGKDTASDTVSIFATTNTPPNAVAGSDQTVLTGVQVILDGSASFDPDNSPDPLTYEWSFGALPDGSTLTNGEIAGANTAHASFTPDVDGLYALVLTVSDGHKGASDEVVITAESNTPPSADAGPDQLVFSGETAILDGSASYDPDNRPQPLTYSWSFVSVPQGSGLTSADIEQSDTAHPSFTPDVISDYVLRLTVSDGRDEDSDNVMVTAVAIPTFDLHPETINLKSHGGPKSVTGVLKAKDIRSFAVFMDTDLVVPGGAFTLINEYVDQYGNLVTFEIFNLDHEGSYIKLEDCDEDDKHYDYEDDESGHHYQGEEQDGYDKDHDDDRDDDKGEDGGCLYTLILKFDRDEIIAGFDDGSGSWAISKDTDLTSVLMIGGLEIGVDVNRVIAPPDHEHDKHEKSDGGDHHADDHDSDHGPFAPVVQGSGVLATGGRKFPMVKAAGRNASEPICSLVKLIGDADPVDRWGRPLYMGSETETVRVIFRGSRVGMLRKTGSPVLETRCGAARGAATMAYKETKSLWAESGVGGVQSTV